MVRERDPFREEISDNFGHTVRRHLEGKRLSGAWLAAQIGCSASRLNKWLNGNNQIPFVAVKKICDALGNLGMLEMSQKMELFDLAGYPLPSWVGLPAMRNTSGLGSSQTGHDSTIANGVIANGVEIVTAKDLATHFRFTAKHISSAKQQVCDTTWGSDLPSYTDDDEVAYQEYIAAISDACRRGVRYREIMTFNDLPEHYIERADHMLQQNLTSYSLRYFDITLSTVPPLLSFTIVDSRAVYIALYRHPYHPIEEEIRLAVSQPDVSQLFQDYFDTLWAAASKIKEGDWINQDAFEQLRSRFSPYQQFWR
jgi:hypothetical protein